MATISWQCLMSPGQRGFGELWADYPLHMSTELEYRMSVRNIIRSPHVSWGGWYYIDIDTMEQASRRNGERRRVRRVLTLQEGPRFEDATGTPTTGGAANTGTTDVPPPASGGTSSENQAQ